MFKEKESTMMCLKQVLWRLEGMGTKESSVTQGKSEVQQPQNPEFGKTQNCVQQWKMLLNCYSFEF